MTYYMTHSIASPPRETLTCLNNVNLTESSYCIYTSQINFIKSIQRKIVSIETRLKPKTTPKLTVGIT